MAFATQSLFNTCSALPTSKLAATMRLQTASSSAMTRLFDGLCSVSRAPVMGVGTTGQLGGHQRHTC
ncbi:hypothetical protein WJX73_006492 [Symbiochloris irregularis]|uniref:Uncharacterized protein n=1 Tax=Symbiochloris irregularis TaxID=706552 RepID=A0AAW1P7P6_9CHLO